jgi:DNA-binding IclR family transcriptional regulator
MKPSINPAISRSLKILEILASASSSRFKDLAAACGGVSHASLSRLLTDLEALGYVSKEEGGYRLLRGLQTGSGASELPGSCQKILESLSRDLDLSAGVFAPLGRTCMAIVARCNVGETAIVGAVGTEMPQYAVHGFAKIFLAHATPAIRHEIYSALPRYVSHQKPPFETWNAALDATAKMGFAVESMEWQAHVARFALSVSRTAGGIPDFALGVIGGPGSLANRKTILARLGVARAEMLSILDPGRHSSFKPKPKAARRPSALARR